MYVYYTDHSANVSSEGDAPETDGEDGVMVHEVANILHSITY